MAREKPALFGPAGLILILMFGVLVGGTWLARSLWNGSPPQNASQARIESSVSKAVEQVAEETPEGEKIDRERVAELARETIEAEGHTLVKDADELIANVEEQVDKEEKKGKGILSRIGGLFGGGEDEDEKPQDDASASAEEDASENESKDEDG